MKERGNVVVEFSEEEEQIIDRIGAEHTDYVLCALFNHRNEETVNLDEESGTITVENMGVEVNDPNSMLEKYTETDDHMEAIKAGIALLECSVSFMNQVGD